MADNAAGECRVLLIDVIDMGVKRFFTMIKRFSKYTSPNEWLPYWRATAQRRDINNG